MKYFSKKVIRHGIKFDSTSEADRYDELLLQQDNGMISSLETQKGFEIIPKLLRKEEIQLKTKVKTVYRCEERAAWYHCDFYYYDNNRDVWVVEEFKSEQTAKLADYRLRKKLIKRLIAQWNEELGTNKYEFKEIIYAWKTSKKKTSKKSSKKPRTKSTAKRSSKSKTKPLLEP